MATWLSSGDGEYYSAVYAGGELCGFFIVKPDIPEKINILLNPAEEDIDRLLK